MPIFRVPVQGLTRLAASIGGGDSAYQQGYQNEMQTQSAVGRAIADARLKNAQADQEEQLFNMRTPEAIKKNAMFGSGIPEDGAADVDEFLKTGKIARTIPLPAGVQGPVENAPEWAPRLPQVGRSVMALNNALALGDKNSSNVAESIGRYRDQGLSDDIISGKLAPTRVAQGQYAAGISKNEPFKANEWGSTNIITGAVDDSGGAAQRFGKKRISESVENYAQANNANASAESNRADRDLKRSKIGQTQTTTLPDGTVIATAPKPGAGGKIPAEVQRMNIALRSLDEGLNAYEELLKGFNPSDPRQQLNPETRAKASSLVADLQLQLKEAQALGALTGPDLEILDKALASPTSLAGFVYGRGGLSAQLGETRKSLQRRRNALAAEYDRPDLANPSGAKKSITVDY